MQESGFRRITGKVLFVLLVLMWNTTGTVAQQTSRVAVADDADQPLKTSVRNPDAVAVVIGISQYHDHDIPPAGYATNDADAVVNVLTQTLGYSRQRVLEFKNDDVTLGRFKGAVRQRLAALVQPGKSDIFFYYSGHGEPNTQTKEAYLIPWDFDSQDLPTVDTAYGVKDLYVDLAKLNARSVTVLLESCFTGSSKNGTLIQGARPLSIEVNNPAQAMPNGLVITASGASEIASDHPDRPHGLMTYYWLRAMHGEAADDQGRVTPNGLRQYLRDKVSATARTIQRAQTPELVVARGDAELLRVQVSALKTGNASVSVAYGRLRVTTIDGGELVIDGVSQTTLQPGGVFDHQQIPVGPHVLELRKDGAVQRTSVVVEPNTQATLTIRLAADKPKLETFTGKIAVTVEQGGTLFIDGKQEQILPPFARFTSADLPAGSHGVRVESAGYTAVDQTVTLRPNETSALNFVLKPTATTQPARGSTNVADVANQSSGRGGSVPGTNKATLIKTGFARWVAKDEELMSPIVVTAKRNADFYEFTAEGTYRAKNGLNEATKPATYVQFYMSELIANQWVPLDAQSRTQDGSWQPGASFHVDFKVPTYLIEGTNLLNMRLCMGGQAVGGCYPTPNLSPP